MTYDYDKIISEITNFLNSTDRYFYPKTLATKFNISQYVLNKIKPKLPQDHIMPYDETKVMGIHNPNTQEDLQINSDYFIYFNKLGFIKGVSEIRRHKISVSEGGLATLPDPKEVFDFYTNCGSLTNTLKKFKLTRQNFIDLCGKEALPGNQKKPTVVEQFIQSHNKDVFESDYRQLPIKDLLAKYSLSNRTAHDIINTWGIRHKTRREIQQTNLQLYGVREVFQSESFKQQTRITCEQKYGCAWTSQIPEAKEKAKATCSKRTEEEKEIILNKSRQTSFERFGVDNYSKSDKFKQEYQLTKEQRLKKVFNTMRQNNSFRSSKQEELFYEALCAIFDVNDIYKQYRDEKRYPFNCDFYIKSLDLFIELNLHYSHGFHPFNEANPEDLALLEKYKVKNTPGYNKLIEVWTERDVIKYKYAHENSLNYVALYDKKQIHKFLKEYKK